MKASKELLKIAANPNHFDNLARAELERFVAQKNSPVISSYVENYSKLSLPFCLPSFKPLEMDNPTHRFDDQIIRGFPFTSASWPWPEGNSWQYQQPVAQINLERASLLLGTDLGAGLLQVWLDDLKSTIRVIPTTSLSEPLDIFYPENPPWIDSDEKYSESVIWHDSDEIPYPRIEWMPMCRMFPKAFLSMGDWCEINTNLTDNEQEELAEEIESLKIPRRLWNYFHYNYPPIRLGGYPDGIGNDSSLISWPDIIDPSSQMGERLLLYIDGPVDGATFYLVVTFRPDKTGQIIFESNISCDH